MTGCQRRQVSLSSSKLPLCHGRGREFESRRPRHIFQKLTESPPFSRGVVTENSIQRFQPDVTHCYILIARLALPRIVSVALNAHPCGTLIADLIDELATLMTVALGGLAVSASPRRVGNPFCERTQFCISKSLVGEIKEERHFHSGRQTSMRPACSG